MTSDIAILGTGRMGAALAAALLDAGHEVTVWNRTADKARPLQARGARLAASVAEAVASAPIVLVNVRDYEVSAELLADASTALAGRLLVELSSGTPAQARAAAKRVRDAGGQFLSGAIMATPNFIGTPDGVVLLSGPAQAYAGAAETLQALGGQVRHVGEGPGQAQALDLALLTQMWGLLFGALHALAICEAEDVDLAIFSRERVAFLPTVEGAVEDLIARKATGRLAADEATLASIATHYGAFQHMLAAAPDQGIDDSIAQAWNGLFQRAIEAGRLDDDFAVLTRFMRRNA